MDDRGVLMRQTRFWKPHLLFITVSMLLVLGLAWGV